MAKESKSVADAAQTASQRAGEKVVPVGEDTEVIVRSRAVAVKPVPPLKDDALVRLKRPFRVGLESYAPSRFGVLIPAGTVLPRDAIILKEKVAKSPEFEEVKVEDVSGKDDPESKQVLDKETGNTPVGGIEPAPSLKI